MLAEFRRKKTEAHICGDRVLYTKAKCGLEKEIKRAQVRFKSKIEEKSDAGDERSVWQALDQMTDYQKKTPAVN